MNHTSPIALTIAGSDSGGGAGIQADLKTFHQFGVFGTSVVTAVTAQNTVGVTAVHAVPIDVVRAQIEAVATDLRPEAFKTGMLATRALVHAVAEEIHRFNLNGYVLDPVMVATSGDRLLDQEAESAIAESLLPLATLTTPNLHEAAILTGQTIRSRSDMEGAARELVRRGAPAVLLKGGHLEGEEDVFDLFLEGGEQQWLRHVRLSARNTHGTGCTLSAAVAAGLAHGRPLVDAVDSGIQFVHDAIRRAPDRGRGHGPVDHFAPPPVWASPPVRDA
jgi:hydroxymethylpyrimidine/phosphomethylpyrimidine kinase